MSKVEVTFQLARPLGDSHLKSIAAAHAIYGILRVHLDQPLDRLTVEFDASRLTEADVEAALLRAGIPLAHDRPR